MERMRDRKVLKSSHEKVEFKTTDSGERAYEIQGSTVTATFKELSPLHETPADTAVMFITGWSAGDAKTLEHLSGRFAVDFDARTLQVRTATEGIRSQSLEREAEALGQLIEERGLKHITIAAHSEGGTKAANLIARLQREQPHVEVRGLVLMDPVGLYPQKESEVISGFVKDSMVRTPASMAKNFFSLKPMRGRFQLIQAGLQASSDIIMNIAREAIRAKSEYLAKFRAQLAEMVVQNENYQRIRCPVVLIVGAQDPVSSREKILPSKDDPMNLTERSEILRELFFHASPRVDMVVPEKLGHHGLPHFRPEEVSRASMYLLKRGERRQQERKAA
jgi:pimeloyl-ACP methyl ester carboxylesterase